MDRHGVLSRENWLELSFFILCALGNDYNFSKSCAIPRCSYTTTK